MAFPARGVITLPMAIGFGVIENSLKLKSVANANTPCDFRLFLPNGVKNFHDMRASALLIGIRPLTG